MEMLKIGDFSKLTGISVRALRLYAEMGLLKPVHVDSTSGYRYYNEDQLKQAQLILVLRRLGMPLPVIRQVIRASTTSQARETVDAYWQEVEAQIIERRRLLDFIHNYIQGIRTPVTFSVSTKLLPETQALSIRQCVSIQDLVDYIGRSIRTLKEFGRVSGLEPAGAPVAIYYGAVNEDSHGPVEICLPVRGEISAREGIRVQKLAAVRVAYTTTSKRLTRFPEILLAYEAVYQWIKQNGYALADFPREIYLYDSIDVNSLGPDDPFAEVAWPYR